MTAISKKVVKGTEPKIDDPTEIRKYFNLQKVIAVTGVQGDKIYNNMKGAYNSLTQDEKKRIATCMMVPVKVFFEKLGMAVSFSRLDLSEKEEGLRPGDTVKWRADGVK